MKFTIKLRADIELDGKFDIFVVQRKLSDYFTHAVELDGIKAIDIDSFEFVGDIDKRRVSILRRKKNTVKVLRYHANCLAEY